MPPMLPARQFSALRLADVLSSCLSAVLGRENALHLAAVDKAVVVLVDGLGVSSLRARAGHARYLTSKLTRAGVVDTVFPATTAAAITSLTTGVEPGRHGLVGYRALDAANDRVVNQLSGWDDRMPPDTWQRTRTIFERATDDGVPSFTIGPKRYAHSGFTLASLRGARYVPAEGIADRFAAARALLDAEPRALVYLYVPELDVAAHAHGWESAKWLAALEALDSAAGRFAAGLRRDEGLIVTADHGVLDVPATKHVLFDSVPELVAPVRHIGGDPRCLYLYLDETAGEAAGSGSEAATALAETWREVEGERAWIFTRAEAVTAGLFGSVDDEVLPRIGDVIVAARKAVAYYDSREPNQSARSMIGQHGSLTDEELRVPVIRDGAFGA
ncbi:MULTISPECIES: alkaline phosphatase family protein [unclassified Cryobacterium]|uniref:alkaline phosphatase family protein n=1 Tax=unclassified Cryobacterium TaxID=2649013 RepID=UPI002AB50E1A|nr:MULTISPECIES: alkaline phosphatase family protein [unclassified Cryobacterium]MDY7543861.1 alkaline phosphatase family protein [Cryobacterium sp. 5B3]MEA9998540.1 alkaline phosphatase family protein [Cryobacterium sp. RTS3]MEB0264448.1 alkaline phosphatase family protein [Cryobacterium sp. 10I5]MEB0273573.1 alkaline phosphatase family protein [Cryobacterium sp. 5B3]